MSSEKPNQQYEPVHTNKVGGSPFTGVTGWIDNRLPIIRMFKHEYLDFQVPKSLSYFWSFGGILTICLILLIVTGLSLGMHYKPDAKYAFDSVEKIMRDVNFGWLIRYAHMNLASFFFIAVYLHIFRGLYYGSYKEPRQLMWLIGIVIFFLMMATAFLGYTLPWGQMSYWGATATTNLFSAIPLVIARKETISGGADCSSRRIASGVRMPTSVSFSRTGFRDSATVSPSFGK